MDPMTGRPSWSGALAPGACEVSLLTATGATEQALTLLCKLAAEGKPRVLAGVKRGNRLRIFEEPFFESVTDGSDSDAHAELLVSAALVTEADDLCADLAVLGWPATLDGARGMLWTTETRDGGIVHWLLAIDDVAGDGNWSLDAGDLLHIDPSAAAAAHWPSIGIHRQAIDA